MGQKTNPNIYRLGKTKTWKFKYFEKKSTEAPLYTFYNIEIEKFIAKFFKNNGLIIDNCKLYHYSNNSLNIFISYYATTKITILISKKNKNQKIKFTATAKQKIYRNKKNYKQKYYYIRKKAINYLFYNKFLFKRILNKNINSNKLKGLIQLKKQALQIKRLNLLNYYKTLLSIQNHKNVNTIENNFFFKQLLDSIFLFTGKKFNINLTIKQLNNNLKYNMTKQDLKVLKKNLTQLRKYKQNSFFKNGLNLIFTYVKLTGSSNLISEFIATEFQKYKKHNSFLRFLIITLRLFVKSSLSNIEAVKIIIKGRLNGNPRSRHRIINIGNGIPVLTLNSNINYSESVAFTSNGTLGIKVWTLSKTCSL